MAVIIPTFAPMHPFGFVSNESLKFQSEMDNLLSEMRTSIFKSVRDSCTAACKEPSKEPLENSSKAHHLQSQIPRSTFTCEPLQLVSTSARSVANCSDGPFKVTVPVSGFKPEELSVKVAGNSITIEAKHEEKDENTGNVRSFQQMRRSFFLPTPFDGDALVSSLSTEGVLTVTAPRKVQQPSASQKSIEIPITRPSIDSNPTQ